MRTQTNILAKLLVMAAAGLTTACNSTIDKEPNVVLEVENLIVPPVSGSRDAATGICVLTLTNSTATFKNKPKNAKAGESPYNDIVLQRMSVGYTWDDGLGVTSGEFGLGGTVPAAGSSTAQFAVVNAQDLTLPNPREGHTASLTMTFWGTTVSGETVSVTTGGTLTINTCQ